MKIVIDSAKEIWKSGDGQRKLYEVSAGGEKYKTFSDVIGCAAVGTEFDVVTENKIGKKGPEVFIKQAPKAGGFSGGGGGGFNTSQYIIGQAVNLYTAELERGWYDEAPPEDKWAKILEYAKTLKRLQSEL